jgi:hypothetical protein
MFCLYKETHALGKQKKTYRFNSDLYSGFKGFADRAVAPLTEALKRDLWVGDCEEADRLV